MNDFITFLIAAGLAAPIVAADNWRQDANRRAHLAGQLLRQRRREAKRDPWARRGGRW